MISLGKVPKRRWCQAIYKQQAEHAGIHGNPESGNYPGTVTLIESVKILSLPTYILTMTNRRVTYAREI